MSEWLTTGAMIDRLKVGEVAECCERKYKVKFSQSGIIYVDDDETIKREYGDGGIFFIANERLKGFKWRILPKYVTFEEAVKALDEGKTVYFQGSYGWNEKVTPKDYESVCFEHSPIRDHGLQDIVKGKWTIAD